MGRRSVVRDGRTEKEKEWNWRLEREAERRKEREERGGWSGGQ